MIDLFRKRRLPDLLSILSGELCNSIGTDIDWIVIQKQLIRVFSKLSVTASSQSLLVRELGVQVLFFLIFLIFSEFCAMFIGFIKRRK